MWTLLFYCPKVVMLSLIMKTPFAARVIKCECAIKMHAPCKSAPSVCRAGHLYRRRQTLKEVSLLSTSSSLLCASRNISALSSWRRSPHAPRAPRARRRFVHTRFCFIYFHFHVFFSSWLNQQCDFQRKIHIADMPSDTNLMNIWSCGRYICQ